MNNKDSKIIWESYAGAQALRNSQIGAARAGAGGGGGGGMPMGGGITDWGPTKPVPTVDSETTPRIQMMVKQHLGFEVQQDQEGNWLKIGDKFSGGRDAPLSDEERVQVDQITKQVQATVAKMPDRKELSGNYVPDQRRIDQQ
jgi:hypothetical protein